MTVLRAAHGAGDLIQLMREGDSPAGPAAPAKPVQPIQAQPAKPAQAAPVETTTTTYNRTTGVTETRTASETTTITKPRAKGKPAGDAPKDVAKGAKRGPKTDPDAPHNAAIRKEMEKLEAEGNKILHGGDRGEKLIETKGGIKSGRRPDIIYRTPDGKLRGRNVGKTNADGTPVKREQEAVNDLNNHSEYPTDFVPYDR